MSYLVNYTQIYKSYYEFLKILNQNRITSLFQPIVNLKDASILGYEALSRGPGDSEFHSPLALFEYAKKNDLLWDLDTLCRQNALERAGGFLKKDQLLFINVDANIFNDSKYQSGLTKKRLGHYQIAPHNIVFEITEHSCVDSVDLYEKALLHYKNQGYKIAVDDVGTGYSNLNMLITTSPHFLKVDMALIRDIDKDFAKQSLLKTFKSFCESGNMKLIAEGVETLAELETLIAIGVDYGQGYFLKKPSLDSFELDKEIRDHILRISSLHDNHHNNFPLALHVGSIARDEITVEAHHQGYTLEKIFRRHPHLMGIPVLDNGRPVGLVMRNKFYSYIGRQYGLELFLKKEVTKLMEGDCLILDYYMPIKDASKLSMNRSIESIYDHMIIVRDGQYVGVVTIKDLLEKTTQIELNIARHSNPLTGLPGNILIEKKLQESLTSGKEYCVLYLDLDYFKPFNDQYGFEKGDAFISLTGQIIKRCVEKRFPGRNFIGHIGGDDFVVALYCKEEEARELGEEIIRQFDQEKVFLFSEADIANGYFCEKNRQGRTQKFPLTTLSIALINGSRHNFQNVYQLSEHATRTKSRCKKLPHSVCIAD